MQTRQKILQLPEGDYPANVSLFNQSESRDLVTIYQSWRTLCQSLEQIGARAVNLPEGLSEGAFATAKGFWRCTGSISGANSSFDCYDPAGTRGHNRIQLKACSVVPDLTSFGPNSKWDRIFFADFYRNGHWDKTFDIYELNTDDIYNIRVNSHQTFAEQQSQGRRPRFSIYKDLIRQGRYISKETFKIQDEGVFPLS